MRKLIALLLVAAAGYYLYTHQELWRKYVPASLGALGSKEFTNYDLKQPFAWKVTTRDPKGYSHAVVEAMDGDRWRLETRKQGATRINVAVCDGINGKADPPLPSVIAVDPRPMAREILAETAKVAALSKKMSPQVTEQMDGLACWKTSVTLQGVSVQFWVDSSTGFPVRFDGIYRGTLVEVHFSPVQVDFAKRGSELFNTGNMTPAFTDELGQ